MRASPFVNIQIPATEHIFAMRFIQRQQQLCNVCVQVSKCALGQCHFLTFKYLSLTIERKVIDGLLHDYVRSDCLLPIELFSMAAMKASPFINLEPGKSAVEGWGLVYDTGILILILGIVVALDEQLRRPHRHAHH